MIEIGSGLATLLGAAVGAGASFATISLQHRKERRTWWDSTRKDGYVRFLGSSHAYFLALMDLRHGLKRSHADIDGLYRQANQLRSQMVMAAAEVDLVSPARTRDAAQRLMNHLSATNDTLFAAKRASTGPSLAEYRDFDRDYQTVVDAFVSAAAADFSATRSRARG